MHVLLNLCFLISPTPRTVYIKLNAQPKICLAGKELNALEKISYLRRNIFLLLFTTKPKRQINQKKSKINVSQSVLPYIPSFVKLFPLFCFNDIFGFSSSCNFHNSSQVHYQRNGGCMSSIQFYTWMDLEDIMLSEISQTEKDKFCMFSLICDV